MIINDFGLGLLEYSHSSFVSSGEAQVSILRAKVETAIQDLNGTSDPILQRKIDLNWSKLKKTVNSIQPAT